MKEKLIRFMQGRYGAYGADALSKFLLGVSLALLVLSLFIGKGFFYVLALALLGYTYFRLLSRKYSARAAENQAFLKRTEKIRRYFAGQKNRLRQRKTHHIYKCPGCGQKIRVPRGKGRIAVRCPKCGGEFIKIS